MNSSFEPKNAKILVIDDEQMARSLICTVLTGEGYQVLEAESVAEGIAVLREQTVDLVLTDLRIGEGSGMDVIRIVQQSYPQTEVMLMTAYGTIENAVEAINAGAFDYVTKPFSNQHLLVKVQKGIERKMMRQELSVLRQHVAMSYGFDNIVGISKPITQLKEMARRIAPTDITVLITGPSGTGKELFARAIHHHSNRRSAHFVAIDCSAIPETLLESELFGYMKGAFTHATQNKKGLFEEADGGTVFLDEVSNMPNSTQSKLLRFLQDSEIRPVGAVTSRKVNVRIVAATNRDLKDMVAEGTFREDLYFRLNVIPLNLPPLVDRAEDVAMLVEYFLRKISHELKGPAISITRPAIDRLLSHRWPGNVRELENTMKRGAALCHNHQIDIDDIIFIAGERPVTAEAEVPNRVSLTIKGGLLDSGQRSLIIKALNDNDWNFTKTATDLGIGRTTLWRKVKKYNLAKVEAGEPVGVTDAD
ncbi:MAG: sigma-54 dependent transcriptional regulator [Candidatus Zixiibacteriota bacterium]